MFLVFIRIIGAQAFSEGVWARMLVYFIADNYNLLSVSVAIGTHADVSHRICIITWHDLVLGRKYHKVSHSSYAMCRQGKHSLVGSELGL